MKYFPLVFEKFPPQKYPLRQAELVTSSEFWDYFDSVEPLSLSQKDWDKVARLEQEWFPQIEKIYDLEISVHLFEYYPQFAKEVSRKELEQMTKEDLDELESKTKKKAKQAFLQEFRSEVETKQELDKIDNPKRKGFVLNPDKIYQGLKEFLDFRQEVKQKYSSSKGLEKIIAGIYWQKIDYLLFWYTPEIGRILNSYENRTEVEDKLLDLIAFGNPNLYDPGKASQTVGQIDQFIWGVGEHSRLGEIIENVDTSQQNRNDFPYEEIKMNGDQAQKIARLVLDAYGLDDWEVELTSTQSTFSVNSTKKKVKVPKDTDRGIVRGLRTLAHEIEGHVLVNMNEKKFFNKIKLLSEHGFDRFHPFGELPAIYVGEKTVEKIINKKSNSNPYPYYLVCLQEKARGGDFKSCFYEFAQRYIEEKGFESFDELKEQDNWQEFGNYSFPRTLRIFRNFTPLDDTSGEITYSKDTAYIEQEVIKQELDKRDLNRLFFTGHLNVYVLPLLKLIGLLGSQEIQLSKYVLAKRVWPKIEKGLKEGKDLNEIILHL